MFNQLFTLTEAAAERQYQQVILRETTLNRMFDVHSKAGYVIISAFRGENTEHENIKQSAELKKKIRASGFSYFPVWGGYVETIRDEDGEETTRQAERKEKSFVITNFKAGSSTPYESDEKLFELGKELAKEYGQEAFLYKPQGEETKAHFVTPTGEIDFSFSTASPATAADKYFTSLAKSREKTDRKAFTFREGVVYLAQPPKTVSIAQVRYGEEFFNLAPEFSGLYQPRK